MNNFANLSPDKLNALRADVYRIGPFLDRMYEQGVVFTDIGFRNFNLMPDGQVASPDFGLTLVGADAKQRFASLKTYQKYYWESLDSEWVDAVMAGIVESPQEINGRMFRLGRPQAIPLAMSGADEAFSIHSAPILVQTTEQGTVDAIIQTARTAQIPVGRSVLERMATYAKTAARGVVVVAGIAGAVYLTDEYGKVLFGWQDRSVLRPVEPSLPQGDQFEPFLSDLNRSYAGTEYNGLSLYTINDQLKERLRTGMLKAFGRILPDPNRVRIPLVNNIHDQGDIDAGIVIWTPDLSADSNQAVRIRIDQPATGQFQEWFFNPVGKPPGWELVRGPKSLTIPIPGPKGMNCVTNLTFDGPQNMETYTPSCKITPR